MNIFIIGATGFVGGALAEHLRRQGHHITGLARTPAAGTALEARGIAPVPGDLNARLRETIEAAQRADSVIYAAQPEPFEETKAVDGLVQALAGSGKDLVFLSGTGVFLQRTGGAWSPDRFTEFDSFEVEPLAAARKAAEDTVLFAASYGIRAMVIRPGLIWGPGDHGHVPMTYQSVAVAGAACYVGEGLNTYGHVHIDDVVRLFSLALAEGAPGGLYHAVAGEVPNRWIAQCVADDMSCPTRSVSEEEAAGIWGPFGALVMGASSRCSAPRSHDELGWSPRHTDMLSMIGEPRLRELASPQ